MSAASLRGGGSDGSTGEDHDPETHLIPRLIRSVLEPGEPTTIFGTDYPTADGTCVLDAADIVINVPLKEFGSLDSRRYGELVAAGYQAAEAMKDGDFEQAQQEMKKLAEKIKSKAEKDGDSAALTKMAGLGYL